MFKRLILLLIFLTPFSLIGKEYIFPFFNFTERFYGIAPFCAGLIVDENYIYGTTGLGGKYSAGVIFRVNKDGSDYRVLHHFSGNETTVKNGSPRGKLLLDGDVIYGTCNFYSGNFGGTVYRINKDGSEFKILADFYDGTGGFIHGKGIYFGGLTLVNGVFYGSTSRGGAEDNGVLFSLNMDGSNFKTFFTFAADGANGLGCRTGLKYYKGRLYGVTSLGGSDNSGTVFSVKPDGSDFKVISNLVEGYTGYGVGAPCLVIDDVLYFPAPYGGASNKGTICSVRIDGSDLRVLHSFNGSDGYEPGSNSGLVNVGDYLYSATRRGGENDAGVLCRLKRDGTEFEVIDHFSDIKGSSSKGELVYAPPYLIGTTYMGGSDGSGTIFRYKLGYLYSVVTYTPEAYLTTAKLWGDAWKKENHDILEKGFCWGENENPDIEDNVKVAGKGEGKFVTDIYSLNPGKTYYVRAYVKTSMGTFYGETKSFRSPHPKVSGIVLMDGKPASGVVVDFIGREKLVTGINGTFSTEVYYGWSGAVVISKEGVKFTRSEFSYTNLKENVTIEVTGSPKDKE